MLSRRENLSPRVIVFLSIMKRKQDFIGHKPCLTLNDWILTRPTNTVLQHGQALSSHSTAPQVAFQLRAFPRKAISAKHCSLDCRPAVWTRVSKQLIFSWTHTGAAMTKQSLGGKLRLRSEASPGHPVFP